MTKSLNLLTAAALLAALGACNRQQPNRVAPEDERQLNSAVGDFRDATRDMRNDAANVPGAVQPAANVTEPTSTAAANEATN